MEKLSSCPICYSRKLDPSIDCKDHMVSQEAFSLVKCGACNFVFTNPRPSATEIGKYYQSEEYISHSDTKKGIINMLYHRVRKHTLGKKLELAEKISNGRTILDIGSGSGGFLNRCKNAGWTTLGIETDPNARQYSKTKFNLDVLCERDLPTIKKRSFDLITMWHVLEHIHDLTAQLQQIVELLKSDGTLLIAVPNMTSLDSSKYKEFWAGYDVPRHLYHFVPSTICKLLAYHKMECQAMMPMPFDAYYVSLLSEKYIARSNSFLKITNYPRALLRGYLSNIRAKKSVENCCSIIYVFKRGKSSPSNGN